MAQSIVGTDLATTWAANSSRVCVRVRCDWNIDGDYADAYEDITSRVASLSISHALYNQLSGLPLLGSTGPSTATLLVLNEDRWFSPDNAAGLVGTYTDLADGIFRIPIQIELGYYGLDTAADYLTQFVGEIEGVDESESFGEARVTFQCTDASVALLQYKLSTTVSENIRPDTSMLALLTTAGVATTDLDVALTEIPYSWLDDENVWEECRALATADGGMFFASKIGVPTFRRMTSLLERTFSTVAQAALTEGNAKFYRSAVAWRDCYNGVIMEWAGRYEGTVDELYRAPRPLEIPPGTTFVEEARFRYPSLAAITPVYGTDYQAITAAPHVAAYGATGVQLSATPYGQRMSLSFTNNLTDDTLYVVNLKVRGEPLIGDEAQEKRWDQVGTLIPAEKTYPVRGNSYCQTLEQVSRVGPYLLDRLSQPRRLIEWRGMACPWLELLDRVSLSHHTMTPNPGVDFDCYVVGIGMAHSPDGDWNQTLTLLPVTDLFAYTDYFIIGTSVYADAASDKVAY